MKVVLGIFTVLATLLVGCLFMAVPVMLLWNWLMPEIFGLIEISFWQALGLCVLSSALFKSSTTSSK